MQEEPKLLSALRNRSPEAFQELFNLYSDKMYRLAVGVLSDENDAEDVVQEAFIKFFEKMDTFEGRSSIGTWLYRVTYNASIDRVRRAKTGKVVDADLSADEEDLPMPASFNPWDASVTELYDQQEMAAMLESAMGNLPDSLREAFLLRDIEELSTEEAAEVLGISQGAVKVRLHRARLLMREQLSVLLGETEKRN